MSANCHYSKKFLPLAKLKWDEVSKDEDAYKIWLKETFLDDVDALYSQLISSLNLNVERTNNIGSKKIEGPMIQGRMILDETDNTSYKDIFVGRTDLLISLEQSFKSSIISKSVFDISNSEFIEANKIDKVSGLTILNKNIVDYKQSLIDTLYDIMDKSVVTPKLKYTMSANEYSAIINQTLSEYLNWRGAQSNTLKGLSEYTILSKFDEMLAKLTDFVAPKNIDLLDSPNRYEYKGPTVQHYTSFGDKNASIESQTSNLVRILLSVLPEVELDSSGHEQIVNDSFIGLSGFNSAMMALKQELLFGNKLSPELAEQYFSGNNIDLGSIIDSYLKSLSGKKQTFNASYFDMRQTFLIGKLRGLNKFIFGNKKLANDPMGQLLLSDMKSMFFKTEAVSYRGYTIDRDSNRFVGKNLRSNFISTQKARLADTIRGAANFLKTDAEEQSQLINKYNIKTTNSSVSYKKGNENLIVNLSKRKVGHGFTIYGNASPQFISDLANDILQYIIPDTYYRVGQQMEGDKFNYVKDWAPLLAITTLSALNNGVINTVKGGLIDLSGYNNYLLNVSKKLSVIFGAETINVINNPNGDKIPLFQLTNLTYNTKSLLYHLKQSNNAINKDSIFALYPELLTAPQVRSQVRIGDNVKDPSKLTEKELIHLSVLEDFYAPLLENLDNDSVETDVYLQNATFADKPTHYLIGYNLSTKVQLESGETVSLKSLLKEILNTGDSSKIQEFTRQVRRIRINRLANKIVNDYKKVFLVNGLIRSDINSSEIAALDPKFTMNSLKDIDFFLQHAKYNGKSLTTSDLTSLFVNSGIQYDEEIHAYAPKAKGLGSARINETILNYYNTYNNKTLFNERINKARQRFIEDLYKNRVVWNRYDSATLSDIAQRHPRWVDPNSGNIVLSYKGKLHPVLEAYFMADTLLSNEYNAVTIGEVYAHPNKNKRLSNIPQNNFSWARYNKNNYEVSSKGDSRFSAKYATFKQGTVLFGHDVGGRTIESVYQHGVKQNDWITNNNNKTGAPKSNEIIKGNTEEDSYRDGYLPLWKEWARQNPDLISDLQTKAEGKVLTDQYASTMVSQARALAEILNRLSYSNDYDPNKEEGTYEEFSEANRLIAQIKRSVAFGATWHPYTQNLLNGVAPIINIAVMNDVQGSVFTPNGTSDELQGVGETVDSMDGSGWSHPLQARLENNSLLSAGVEENKKSIMMDIDYNTGKPILLKWAVYSLSNDVRRIGYNSTINAESLYNKMNNQFIEKYVDLKAFLNLNNKPIYYYNPNTGNYYKIKDINVINGIENDVPVTYADKLIVQINPNTGEEVSNTEHWASETADNQYAPIRTLYDIDRFFGGCWSADWDPETKMFTWAETNLDVLENIVSQKDNQDLKNKFIAYVVNKSAIKVGAGNVNPETSWSNDIPLATIPMSTRYGGIQMNFDHDLDHADVTEGTQMISALIENCYYPEIVNAIYTDIGEIVTKHLNKLKVPIDIIDDNSATPEQKVAAREKLYLELGKALYRAFKQNNRDTLGLAQSFLELAKQSIDNQNNTYKIPFSAATINGIFISDVISDINRGGIRHKYSGFAGVLNPSFGIIETYRVFNPNTGVYETRMFDGLMDFARNFGLNKASDLKLITLPNGQINPLMKPLNYSTDNIEFEDTIVIQKSNGTFEEPIHVTDFWTRDNLNYRLRKNPSLQAYVHQGYGRNLRGVETYFKVNGKTYSIYDLDSVRASQFLTHLIDKKPITDYQKTIIRRVIGDNWEADLIDSLQRARSITQNALNNLENFKVIGVSEAFGLDSTMDTTVIPVESVWTRAAEIVTGRYHATNFGLNQHDHIYQVKNSKFFRDKMTDIYTEPTTVPDQLYDVVLFEGDKPWLIKIGNEDVIAKAITNIQGISNNPDITYNNDDVVYDDNILINKEGFKFKQYVNQYGEKFNLVFAENVDRYRQLLNSGIFNRKIQILNINDSNLSTLKEVRFGNSNQVTYNISDTETKRIDIGLLSKSLFEDSEIYRLNALKQQHAEEMYESFKKQLFYVGARIPTQAMQSFMPMEVIAFADTTKNVIYVPRANTFLEGSDYDADKAFLMTFDVTKDGVVDLGEDNSNDFYGDQLRNRVVSRILDITMGLKNQLIAQVPINMKAQQEAAASSTLGRAELHLNSDNPAAKFMMQVQNMVGKEVIGISAVSLKAFFALSFYYNTLINDLAQACLMDPNSYEGGQAIYDAFRKLLINNPITNETTSLSNINFDKVLDIIENDSRFDNVRYFNSNIVIGDTINNTHSLLNEWRSIGSDLSTGTFNLRQAILDLKTRVNREDTALADSGLISAATDNAKELILAKINATPDLVDIYTYLLSIGTPFNVISSIMTSKAFNDINLIGQQNIFDESTRGFKTKNLIGFYVGEEIPNFLKYTLQLGYIPSNDQIDGMIKNFNDEIKTLSEGSNEHKDYFIQQRRNKINLLELIRFRNDSWNSLSPDEQYKVHAIRNILPAVDEMSSFGRILGINQGQPTKIYELSNMKKLIPNFVDNLLPEFDFDQFLINPEKQQEYIQQYETVKKSYNILDAMMKVPHFAEMLKTLYYSEKAVRLYSAKANTLLNIKEELENNIEYRNQRIANKKEDPGKISLSQADFKSLDRYINDRIIMGFLTNSGFYIKVPSGTPIYESYANSPTGSAKPLWRDTSFSHIYLYDDLDIASFKWIMDKKIIKELKHKYQGNAFFDNLRPLADPDRTEDVVTGWRLSLQMMDIDSSPNTQILYSQILNGLDEVANNTEYGQTIGDLFYIYNLIVNKDAFGQSSMTRVFENLMLRGTSKYINDYSKYISQLDDNGTINYNLTEAKYRIIKDNSNSRVRLTNDEKSVVNPNASLGSDFTLDLPISSTQNNGILYQDLNDIDDFGTLINSTKNISLFEVLDSLTESINSRLGEESVVFTNSEELKEMFGDDPDLTSMQNSRGFVKDGKIYLVDDNYIEDDQHLGVLETYQDTFKKEIPTLMHEFSHLVLAAMKYGDDKDVYYSMLAKVKQSPLFEKYANRYPNAVGSDLLEEVFTSMVEDYLCNRPLLSINIEEFENNLLKGLSQMLQLDSPITDPKELINKPLTSIISKFASNLFQSETLIDKQDMINNARVRALKERLFNEGFLKQEC